tara:strand:+ start:725 stop:829 length:105 start_codon:yes stop_codon:yes gene_type:complete
VHLKGLAELDSVLLLDAKITDLQKVLPNCEIYRH